MKLLGKLSKKTKKNPSNKRSLEWKLHGRDVYATQVTQIRDNKPDTGDPAERDA